jgi:transposase
MNKNKPKRYSEVFKRKVVAEVLEGVFTKEGAKKHYGIGSNCAILYWMRIYSGHKNYHTPLDLPKGFNSMSAAQTKQIQAARIKELEEELSLEKQRADLWQKIVEIAEEELGLNIKKKFGARPFAESKKKGGQE